MKIKVSELLGADLDYWAAKAEGRQAHIEKYDVGMKECWIRRQEFPYTISYHPSTDWAQGGPIIEREKIHLRPTFSGGIPNTGNDAVYAGIDFVAGELTLGRLGEYGPTPLIAAMRCFVASKFGEEVEGVSG